MIVAFSGHRPNKLPGGYDTFGEKNTQLFNKVYRNTKKIIENSEDKYFLLVSGGAIGFDQMSFDIATKLKKEIKDKKIETLIAIPFKNQYIKWKKEDISRYEKQKKMANFIVYVDEIKEKKYNTNFKVGEYSALKMQKRNEFMVDIADVLIAAWNGDKNSGTFNCMEYARAINKKVYFTKI